MTSTSTDWITVTVYPVDGDNTWSQWSQQTTTDVNVVSSTVTKTGTWADWSAAASSTPDAASIDGQCQLQISVSYGAPVCKF